jgi:hypothetical protein
MAHPLSRGAIAMSDATDRTLLGRMTERAPTPLAAKRLVYKGEELRRKREGTWDPTTMVSATSPEGEALRAHQASLENVTVAQEIAVERLKNETPPHEPTSPPTPLTTTVENGATKAEVLPPAMTATNKAEAPKTELPRAEAATTEPKGSKAETTLPGTTGRKRGRSGSQLGKQKPPAGIAKSTPKLSPKIMRIVLNSLRKYPVLWYAASKAGIHRKTLEYWLKRSAAGDAGYDLKWAGLERRFHEHCESAIAEARQILDDELLQRASGYDKVLTYRGRVMYKINQDLAGRGFQGPDAYLRDENGNPVPETVRKVDTKAQLSILKRFRRDRWDTQPKSGVTKKPKYNTARSIEARRWKADSRRVREEKD